MSHAKRSRRIFGIAVIATTILLACGNSAFAQSTFTYQCRVLDGGTPVNGSIDLLFSLFDDPGGGAQIGVTQEIIGATATDGLVSVDLDFGAGAFDGTPRWLEISIQSPSTGGGGPYTTLAPRQPMHPVPYAIHAATAGLVPDNALDGAYSNALNLTNPGNVLAGDGSGITGIDAGNITGGVLGDAQFGGTYNNVVSLTSVGNVFTGDGSGLFNVDWNNLASVPAGFADGIDNAGDSLWGGANPGDIFYTSGNVGIGTSTPDGRLHIAGGVPWTSNGWTKSLTLNNLTAMELGKGAATKFGIGVSTGAPVPTLFFFTTTADDASAPANYFMAANSSGQVGIGTTTPSAKLSVTTNTTSGGDNTANFTAPAIGPRASHVHYGTTGDWYIRSASAAGKVVLQDAGGRVGINNVNPTSPLTVNGNGTDWTIYGIAGTNGVGVVGSQPSGAGRGVWGLVGTGGFGGVVGDHTAAQTFGILGTINEGVYGSGGAAGKIGVTGISNGNSGVVGGAQSGTQVAGVFGWSSALNGNGIIGEANTGSAAYGVWGRAAQGIGGYFSGGQYALIAAGKARVNTIEIVGGSDLAEPFDVNHFDDDGSRIDVAPGMVVVIDPANPGALMVSTRMNDRRVAGIISGANDLAPGMVLKSEGDALVDGEHPVALTGRVWCWCATSSSAIEPGDMLTTSDIAGHATKVIDFNSSQGAIIGKAMTPLAAGERGLVLVLVNLQ